MRMSLIGIGTAVPAHRIAQADAAAIARRFNCETRDQERLFEGLYRRAGVEKRYSALLDASDGELAVRQSFYGSESPSTGERMRKYELPSGSLALEASTGALVEAGVEAGRITHLVTVSCSGFGAPGFDLSLVRDLGLSDEVARTHVGFMGCHGLMNGLRVAKAFTDSDPAARVLVCAVELCTLHHQYGWDAERIVANALFADGAGAVVGMQDSDRRGRCRLAASGSTVLPGTADAMSWRIGDHGFTMTLSPRVPELIGRHLRPWLDPWLERHGVTSERVGSWAVHPGGPRILAAFGEAAGVDRARLAASYGVLAEYGNMSSPTVLFILDRLLRTGAQRPIVAVAFGPGLTIEAALFE